MTKKLPASPMAQGSLESPATVPSLLLWKEGVSVCSAKGAMPSAGKEASMVNPLLLAPRTPAPESWGRGGIQSDDGHVHGLGGAGVVGVAGGADLPTAVNSEGTGVHGKGGNIGVHGEGEEFGVTGDGGIFGVTGHGGNTGVAGQGSTFGVFGDTRDGDGVYGHSYNNHGVVGDSNNGFGIFGHSLHGIGVIGSAGDPQKNIPGNFAGFFYGRVSVWGDFIVLGAKHAAVPHPDGSHRLLYSVESPEAGLRTSAHKLVNGKAEVRLNPDFAVLGQDRALSCVCHALRRLARSCT